MADTQYTGKKITALDANSSAVDADLFVVGNAGSATMRKLSFSNLANSIRDKLKSLTFTGTGGLNTTDKTLPGAINELNTNMIPLMGTQSSMLSNVDANTLVDTGLYQVGSPETVSHLPSDVNYGQLIVTKTRGYTRQEYYESNGRTVYVRLSVTAGASWSAWEKRPTRAEFDTLTAMKTSTSNFQACDPYNTSSNLYMGGALDAKIRTVINDFSANVVHSIAITNGGPAYGCVFFKASNSYYAGIVWTYGGSGRNSVYYFANNNGTYGIRPLAMMI